MSVECPIKNLVGTLIWKKAVDLDLWCFIKTKNGRTEEISFRNKGCLTAYPFIQLDHDAGVGDQGGDNEENIRIQTLEHIDHAFICANIYAKSDANFSKYDGAVIIKSETKEFIVPLTSKEGGSWCIVAHLDNTGSTAMLNNINKTVKQKPKIEKLIRGGVDLPVGESVPPKKGFMKKLFGG